MESEDELLTFKNELGEREKNQKNDRNSSSKTENKKLLSGTNRWKVKRRNGKR